MADLQSPSVLPQKRPFDDDHTPAVSSPLNPDAPSGAGRPSRAPRPPAREQREKRDSLKKREASGAPDGHTASGGSSRSSTRAALLASLPLRYQITPPKPSDYEPPRDPLFASREPQPLYTPDGRTELRRPLDHAENKRHFRYCHAVADPQFRHKQHYRASEAAPLGPRMSFEDADKSFWFDPDTGSVLCNEKGWRMCRANVVAREGRMYYEVKILRGVEAGTGPPVPPGAGDGPLPHVRMGWARREAPLDAPVGFDGFSYGVTDIRFETMHRSRAGRFFHPVPAKDGAATGKGKSSKASKVTPIVHAESDAHVREGDVIGLEITLPSLRLHHKIVEGSYNPANDTSDGFDDDNATAPEQALDIVRDRIPVHYKGNTYFEQVEYAPTKPMEAYNDRSQPLTISTGNAPSTGKSARSQNPSNPQTPHPQHLHPPLRSLPHSAIRVYRNGREVGTAFTDLLAFLPRASTSAVPPGLEERAGFDDGMLGYFPAVSAFAGGVAEVNLGPRFWCPPTGSGLARLDETEGEDDAADGGDAAAERGDVSMGGVAQDGEGVEQEPEEDTENTNAPGRKLRPMSERYREQIAEDIVWDVVDEASFFIEDGGFASPAGQEAGAGVVAPVVARGTGLDGLVDE